jgi:hypothetical protein
MKKFTENRRLFLMILEKISQLPVNWNTFLALQALYTKYHGRISAGCLPVLCCVCSQEDGPGTLLHRTSASSCIKAFFPEFQFRHLRHLLASGRKF